MYEKQVAIAPDTDIFFRRNGDYLSSVPKNINNIITFCPTEIEINFVVTAVAAEQNAQPPITTNDS